jgi:hypothetical protein
MRGFGDHRIAVLVRRIEVGRIVVYLAAEWRT